MFFEKQGRFAAASLGLLLGLASVAHATTLFEGDLFYTTFNAQSQGPAPNVYKVHFLYDSTPAITLSADCLVTSLTGADGLIFDPNDTTNKTLIVGEQSANAVASIVVGANPCSTSATTTRKADGSAGSGAFNGQAYGLATPDNGHLWMVPNYPTPNGNFMNVTTLPLTADGVSHQITGVDGTNAAGSPNPTLTGVTFIGTQGYYGDATDYFANGHFGTISSTYVTVRVPVVDDVAGTNVDLNGVGGGQASLPTHGMTYDKYSGCIIASGANQIWQLCPPGVAGSKTDGQFHVRAKISTTPNAGGPPICLGPNPAAIDCNVTNWDQTSTDNAGHMFAANNNGDLLFVDYSNSAGRLINDQILGLPAPFMKEQYLRETLDDIINGGGAPPPPPGGCPATQGFWHKAANWTSHSASVGGIIYNGTTHSMTIGGNLYTQSQLLLLMPSGGLHSGAFANSLSQTIAAVLNVAAGAQVTPAATAAISGVNTALTGVQIFSGNTINPAISATTIAKVESFESDLDNYNSAVGLNCSEGVGLNIGSK